MKIPRKRETNCKTVASDKVENEWISTYCENNRQQLRNWKPLRESFGVNEPSVVCCSETRIIVSSAEDLYVLDTYAPLKFQPGKTRNGGVAKYVNDSLSFGMIEFNTRIDLNYIASNFTNLEIVKVIVYCLYNPPTVNEQ